MMNIHVDFDALGAIHAIETVGLHRTRTAIRRALLESCRLVQREARSRHRFIPRTGALEREIVYEVDGANLDGKIYFQMRRAPYAPFVHGHAWSEGFALSYSPEEKESSLLGVERAAPFRETRHASGLTCRPIPL